MATENLLANVPNFVTIAFAGIGLLYMSSKIVNYSYLLLELFALRGTSLRTYGRPGTWAIVTGASDGLGKEFALQLAQRGFNLVLVSRTESKLQVLAQEIEHKHTSTQIKTKILAMDFAENKDSDYAKLKELVSTLDVAILVNNVGQSHDIPVPFIETPEDEMKNIITVNCIGTLKVTRIVAPGMAQRKRGLILTIGSMGGTLPTPLLATYSGSKAFLQQWSTALGEEMEPFGVDVEIVLAYLITGAMSKVRRTSLTVPTPRRFVRDTLSKLGLSCGAQGMAYTSTPFWGHALMQWWIENTVGLMSQITLSYNKKMHVDIRTRALKKKERDAKKSS